MRQECGRCAFHAASLILPPSYLKQFEDDVRCRWQVKARPSQSQPGLQLTLRSLSCPTRPLYPQLSFPPTTPPTSFPTQYPFSYLKQLEDDVCCCWRDEVWHEEATRQRSSERVPGITCRKGYRVVGASLLVCTNAGAKWVFLQGLPTQRSREWWRGACLSAKRVRATGKYESASCYSVCSKFVCRSPAGRCKERLG